MHGFLQNLLTVIRVDWQLIQTHRKLRWSVVGVCFIPALYAFINLASLWDPESNANQLPAIIVNHDLGAVYAGQSVSVGAALSDKLQADHTLDFTELRDEELARQKVREGDADFALIIPVDFSEQALGPQRSGAGRLIVYTSEANSFAGATVAKKFAPEVARHLNELLAEKRWTKVSEVASESRQKVGQLREALETLSAGVTNLQSGLQTAGEGSGQLSQGLARANVSGRQLSGGSAQVRDNGLRMSQGMGQISQGLSQMRARLPTDAELRQLREGSAHVAQAGASLSQGLAELGDGNAKVIDGLVQLKTESQGIPLWGESVAEGARQLEEGSRQVGNGLKAAQSGVSELAQGSQRVSDGVVRLTLGVEKISEGVHSMSARIPPPADLDAFSLGVTRLSQSTSQLSTGLEQLDAGAVRLQKGLGALSDGSRDLASGLKKLDDALPTQLDVPDINPAAYASTVVTEVQVAAPVPNNGHAFASNLVPLSLWMGAVMTAFLFHLRKLPLSLQPMGPWVLGTGKVFIPCVMVFAQVLVMLLMLIALLDLQVAHPVLLLITLLTSAVIFVSIVMALVLWAGDVGKVLGVLFLILQFSASGALIPIQLTSGVFQALHPWMPFTWVIKTIKIAMSDAYDGHWLSHYARMLLTLVVLMPLSAYTGRWVFVPDEAYEPALDIS